MAVSLHRLARNHTGHLEDIPLIGRLSRFGSEEDGVDLIEYAFMVGFLACACLVAMNSISDRLGDFFNSISRTLARSFP